MPSTESQKKAARKWNGANAAERYDQLKILVDKGEKLSLKKHALEQEETLTDFVKRAIKETMERDKNKKNEPMESRRIPPKKKFKPTEEAKPIRKYVTYDDIPEWNEAEGRKKTSKEICEEYCALTYKDAIAAFNAGEELPEDYYIEDGRLYSPAGHRILANMASQEAMNRYLKRKREKEAGEPVILPPRQRREKDPEWEAENRKKWEEQGRDEQ